MCRWFGSAMAVCLFSAGLIPADGKGEALTPDQLGRISGGAENCTVEWQDTESDPCRSCTSLGPDAGYAKCIDVAYHGACNEFTGSGCTACGTGPSPCPGNYEKYTGRWTDTGECFELVDANAGTCPSSYTRAQGTGCSPYRDCSQ